LRYFRFNSACAARLCLDLHFCGTVFCDIDPVRRVWTTVPCLLVFAVFAVNVSLWVFRRLQKGRNGTFIQKSPGLKAASLLTSA